MKTVSRLAAVAVVAFPALTLASNWDIDPAHSSSSFTVKHMVITTVRGEFGKTTGKVVLDDGDISRSSVQATIDVTTLNTRVPDRDAHLKSPDFLDAARYPTITFRSTRVERSGDGRLLVSGDLTMKDVTKPVVLELTGPTQEVKGMKGETRRALSATTKLNRKDFHLDWNKMIEAGPVVGDEVNVQLDIELVKAAGAPRT